MKRWTSKSEKAAAVENLQSQLDIIGEALDASENGFAIWKAERNASGQCDGFTLILINKAGSQAAGKPQLDLVGKHISEVVNLQTSNELSALFDRALREGHGIKEVIADVSADGEDGFYENTVVPFGNDLVFTTYREVSEEIREHSRLVWLTEHDFLTGMPNRANLHKELTQRIAALQGQSLAFVFIDIDHFKKINDTYGHDVGDAVLVNFVKRMKNSLPKSAFVARISGDEFAILLQDLKNEDRLTELIEEVFGAMERHFTCADHEISITCSAGCVLTDGSEGPDEIVRIADKAMYRAKNEGRNRFVIEPAVKLI
jgi:diguanylate cyclase (GGDEF)-like protein